MRLLLALLLLSNPFCQRFDSITASEETDRHREVIKIVKDRCAELGLYPWVTITEEVWLVTYLDREPVPAAMWTSVSWNEIYVWAEILHYDNDLIDAYARHECCHIKLGHKRGTIENEREADQCAREQYGKTDGRVSTASCMSWMQ